MAHHKLIVAIVLVIILISMLACAGSGIDIFHPPTWWQISP